jgi:hypothetical protein
MNGWDKINVDHIDTVDPPWADLGELVGNMDYQRDTYHVLVHEGAFEYQLVLGVRVAMV